ncbi:hypothetical protein ABE527_14320 [Brucella sp. TWI432]
MTESTSSDLVISLPKTITAELFTNESQFDQLLRKIEAAVKNHVPDVTTKKGREAIGSLARKVSSTKVVLDNAGKDLTEAWRTQTKSVNDARNRIKDKLDALRDSVRQPLTDWENAEKARVEDHENRLQQLQAIAGTGFGQSSETLKNIRAELADMDMTGDAWQEFHGKACIMHGAAVDTITRLIADAEKREAEQAELEALRAEKEERDRIDREKAELDRLDRETKERAERERQAEEKRLQDIADAEARAREQAELLAKERAEKAERDAKEAIEKAEREKQEAIEKAEREKQDAIAAAALAEEERKRKEDDERRRREADEENRKSVIRDVLEDVIQAAQIPLETAEIIVTAIATHRVRHTQINF